jgi:hypothetical protein
MDLSDSFLVRKQPMQFVTSLLTLFLKEKGRGFLPYSFVQPLGRMGIVTSITK